MRNIRSPIVAAAAALFLAGAPSIRAQGAIGVDPALSKSLEPGYGVCIFDASGILWSRFEGYEDEERTRPFSEDTVFKIGEVSELFTATAILGLAEQGKIDLDSPVKTYVPDLFLGAGEGGSLARIGELSIGMILSHLGGTDASFFLGYMDYDPFENLRRFLEGAAVEFEPGAKYRRSGGLIDLLGLVVQRASGLRFESAVESAVFALLGMASSTFGPGTSPSVAQLRYKSRVQDAYIHTIPAFKDVVAPSGSMRSSLPDLARFYSVLLGRGAIGDTMILSSRSVDGMFALRSEEVERRQGIGVGYIWMLSLPGLEHLGDIAWYAGKHFNHRNVVILARDLGIGVAVATTAWSIFGTETILPLAVDVSKNYAAIAFGKAEPAEPSSGAIAMPVGFGESIAALYSSTFGLFRIDAGGDRVRVSSDGSYESFYYAGAGEFRPERESGIARISVSPPDAIRVFKRNGILIEATRVAIGRDAAFWAARAGTYRIVRGEDLRRLNLYAFALDSDGGAPIVRGDDGRRYLLAPSSALSATAVCGEDSIFHGRSFAIGVDGGLSIDGIEYRRAGDP